MKLKKTSLFKTKKDFFFLIATCSFVLLYALLIEFQNYKNLTKFNTAFVDAKVIKQYTKTKNSRTYQVLKLKAKQGFTFYTSAKKSLQDIKSKNIKLEVWMQKKSFFEYMTSFYAFSKILAIDNSINTKQKLNTFIESSHQDENISSIYKALYTANPLKKELQSTFSQLGISHLFAISGFHLGVLSGVLFFLFRYPYKFLQNRYFVYRNSSRDLFIIVSLILFSYLLFLDSPASLLRAFTMLLIGFILYDRGVKIISMQTLLLTVMILLSFFPRLLLSIGFWLSVSGVFYIFLFLIYFKHLSKIWQFVLVPFWVYLLMLPFSLSIFGNFSIYHPLSILWTTLFTLFYPLSILLHVTNYADLFDTLLQGLINLNSNALILSLPYKYLILHIGLSLLSLYKKGFIWLLILYSLGIFIWAFST